MRKRSQISRTDSRTGAQKLYQFVASAVADGTLAPGAQLPTERDLAQQFSLPRNAVRKTLGQLEAEGTVTRHVGRGTFLSRVAGNTTDVTDADIVQTSPAELMEARLRLEPAAAELIVTNATPADFERMELCLDKAERAIKLDEFELWDAALHQALAAATHNRFLIRVLDLATAVRQQAEWGKLKDRIVTPERRIRYQEEHRAIVGALKERDAEAARLCIVTHLQHARRNLFGF